MCQAFVQVAKLCFNSCMRKRKIFISVLILISGSLLLGGCTLPFLSKSASLQILSSPRATVMLNNKIVGETPFFNAKIKPNNYNLKLVPVGQGDNILPYQTQLNLKNGLKAALNWNFGASLASSSGYLMTQEAIANRKKAVLMIISEPSGATVKLDGQDIGTTPIQKEDLAPKQYNIEIKAPGYRAEEIVANVEAGYKLVIKVKLGQGGENLQLGELTASSSATPTPAQEIKKVEVLKTPTGWLRVRSAAGLSGKELTKIHPGEKYPFFDKKNGWYQIEYTKGKKGWVSGSYVREVTKTKETQKQPAPTTSLSVTPTPTSPANE